MPAHAFLVVAAVTDRTRHPSPSGRIGLTCNEVRRLLAALLARPAENLGLGCAGPSGAADTSPAPTAATTNDRPANHEVHEHGWSTRLGR
jgi:hypothetical protein